MQAERPGDPPIRYVSGVIDAGLSMSELRAELGRQGISSDCIELLSTVPLAPSNRTMGLHVVTIIAGLVGIGVGLFLSAGTPLLYQIRTGGKPIVNWPIVGIISYEVMMLFGIVTTFVVLVARIRRAVRRHEPVDLPDVEGSALLRITVYPGGAELASVIRAAEQAGVRRIRIASAPGRPAQGEPAGAQTTAVLLFSLVLAGCPDNMTQQPSFQSQEAPRLHSPPGSIPRDSRAAPVAAPPRSDGLLRRGAALFEVNCSHCHGTTGAGDGPAAGFLTELPANLRGAHVQNQSVAALYDILTNGRQAMPAFKGELSAEERWALAYYVHDLKASSHD